MAEARKPAKRKGPTRAAALKALGLTTEDLDTLKAVATARNANDSDTEREALESIVGHRLVTPSDLKDSFVDEGVQEDSPTDEARAVQASATPSLSPETLLRKDDNQQALEDRPAPQPAHGSVPETAEEPVWYIRNLRGVDVGFRLTRQNKQGEKRTNLKPRGQRGDIVKLEPGDLKDAELRTQVAFGLVEVIPEGEALEALKKQYTNAGNQVPAHIAMLRNERGEEYNTAPRTVSDEESMGYKVADLDPGVMQGKRSDREIRQSGGFAQQDLVGPTQVERPGSVVSDGFMAPVQQDMGSDNEKQAEVDARLRAGQFEGPQDALGVEVTVEPTQKVQ